MLEGTPRPCPLQACVKKKVLKNPILIRLSVPKGKKRRSRRRGYFSFSSSSLSLLLPCMPWAVRNCLTHCLSTAEASLPPSLPVQQETWSFKSGDIKITFQVQCRRGATVRKEPVKYYKTFSNQSGHSCAHESNVFFILVWFFFPSPSQTKHFVDEQCKKK